MNAMRRSGARAAVNLGDMPPLVTADRANGPPDRRKLSLRWLSGTVLAALASTSLMGGALNAAVDGARPDEVAAATVVRGIPVQGLAEVMPKGDMLVPDAAPRPSREVIEASTVSHEGGRDYIRTRAFTRIGTVILPVPDTIAAGIPDFDPLRVFSDANPPVGTAGDVLYGAPVEGELTMRVMDFPLDLAAVVTPLVDPVRVELAVREALPQLAGTPVEVAALSLADPSDLDFGFDGADPFAGLGIRVTPENVSFVAMSGDTPQANAGYTEEKVVVLGQEASLLDLLIEAEATEEEAEQITSALIFDFSLVRVPVGAKVWIVLAPADDGTDRFHPVRVSVYSREAHLATVALSGEGGYVAAPEPRGGPNVTETAAEVAPPAAAPGPRPRLYQGLYYTAEQNGMTPELIDDLVRIYSYNVDFNARVAPGDAIELLYSMDAPDTAEQEPSDILYAAITLGRTEHVFYRFRSEDGMVDYYDAEGRSAQQFLMRKPLTGGTFRSGFGARNHPILGRVRMHTGVDWSAPRGTPILATGDGVIDMAEWFSGYGNYVRIRHANGYDTAYGHMDRYGPGIAPGVAVRQGQVIGYVGSTGLSTGPHVHYEVLVNGTQVDPMRVRIPEGRTLEGEEFAAFTLERQRLDALLGKDLPQHLAAAGGGQAG